MTNIKSMLNILNTNNDDIIKSFLKINDLGYDFKRDSGMGTHEIEDVKKFFSKITGELSDGQLNGYYFGYIIKRGVSEEFDILRFSEERVLNIELKSQLPKSGYPGIENQLRRHKYFLGLLKKDICVYTYISNIDKIYSLDESSNLKEVGIEDIVNSIDEGYLEFIELESVNLSDMIISPYSQCEEFAKREYFLTDEQFKIRSEIYNSDKLKKCIIGGAGTGKSLILIDLAKKYQSEGQNVIIIFCSLMEEHESKNIFDAIKIPIKSIRDIRGYEFEKYFKEYDVILLDESQRLWESQYDEFIKLKNKNIVFAVDHQQTLHPTENNLMIEEKLKNDDSVEVFLLKNKVRTDEAMASFIAKLMNRRAKKVEPFQYDNVELVYFNDVGAMNEFIDYNVNIKKFICIEQTEYRTKSTLVLKRQQKYHGSISTHHVVGREYNNVIIILDEHIYYNEEGILLSCYGYYPYLEERLIFQAVTRVKDKLIIVVVNNQKLYKQIQEIITWKSDREVRILQGEQN